MDTPTQADFDRLNRAWTIAEEALAEIQPPTRVSVPTKMEGMPFLCWTRHGGEFRICLQSNPDDLGSYSPIVDKSLRIKVEAIRYFPALRKELLKQVVTSRQLETAAEELIEMVKNPKKRRS